MPQYYFISYLYSLEGAIICVQMYERYNGGGIHSNGVTSKLTCFIYADIYYTVSQKNIPDVFSYNSRKHWRIFIIFGRNVTEKASNHVAVFFHLT